MAELVGRGRSSFSFARLWLFANRLRRFEFGLCLHHSAAGIPLAWAGLVYPFDETGLGLCCVLCRRGVTSRGKRSARFLHEPQPDELGTIAGSRVLDWAGRQA